VVVSARTILTAFLAFSPLNVIGAEMEILSEWERDLMVHLNPLGRDRKEADVDHLTPDYLIRVSIYNEGDGECLFSNLSDSCKERAIYIVLVGDRLYGSRFGFKTPRGFDWRLTGIKEAKSITGEPCALFTMIEEVRERVDGKTKARDEETQVCATSQGFVDPKR